MSLEDWLEEICDYLLFYYKWNNRGEDLLLVRNVMFLFMKLLW